MCPQLPLVGIQAHTRALGHRRCDKPDKNLEKNSDPPIINLIIRERKKFSNFCRKIQSQLCPKLLLVGVPIHICALGCRWCDISLLPRLMQAPFFSEQILLRHTMQFFVHMTASSALQ